MIDYSWEGDELIISQCRKMSTDSSQCAECRHRFKCFTNRSKEIDTRLSSVTTPSLAKLLADMEQLDGAS